MLLCKILHTCSLKIAGFRDSVRSLWQSVCCKYWFYSLLPTPEV